MSCLELTEDSSLVVDDIDIEIEGVIDKTDDDIHIRVIVQNDEELITKTDDEVLDNIEITELTGAICKGLTDAQLIVYVDETEQTEIVIIVCFGRRIDDEVDLVCIDDDTDDIEITDEIDENDEIVIMVPLETDEMLEIGMK